MTVEQRLLLVQESIRDELRGLREAIERKEDMERKLTGLTAQYVIDYADEITGGEDDSDQD